ALDLSDGHLRATRASPGRPRALAARNREWLEAAPRRVALGVRPRQRAEPVPVCPRRHPVLHPRPHRSQAPARCVHAADAARSRRLAEARWTAFASELRRARGPARHGQEPPPQPAPRRSQLASAPSGIEATTAKTPETPEENLQSRL